MNSTQAVDLHDVDAYWKSRNLVDDRHRPYCLRWLQRFLSGPWGAGRLAPNDALAAFAHPFMCLSLVVANSVIEFISLRQQTPSDYLNNINCVRTGQASRTQPIWKRPKCGADLW